MDRPRHGTLHLRTAGHRRGQRTRSPAGLRRTPPQRGSLTPSTPSRWAWAIPSQGQGTLAPRLVVRNDSDAAILDTAVLAATDYKREQGNGSASTTARPPLMALSKVARRHVGAVKLGGPGPSDKMIVWSEADGQDVAISFLHPDECSQVWCGPARAARW